MRVISGISMQFFLLLSACKLPDTLVGLTVDD